MAQSLFLKVSYHSRREEDAVETVAFLFVSPSKFVVV